MAGKEQKVAVILSGGGALGAYEIGVLKALLTGQSPATQFKPLDFDIVTGTSVGGINAGLLLSSWEQIPTTVAQYPKHVAVAHHLEKVWLEDIAGGIGKCNSGAFWIRGSPVGLIRPACYAQNPFAPFARFAEGWVYIGGQAFMRTANFLFSSESFEQRALGLVDFSVFISPVPLHELVHKTISLESLRNSKKTLKIASTNWLRGIVSVWGNADMINEQGYQMILASAALPGIYPPVEVNGIPHVDGGAVMNTPLAPAILAGGTTVHIIYMNPQTVTIPLAVPPNTADDFARTLVIAIGHNVNQDIRISKVAEPQLTIHRYQPHGELGWEGIMNFRREHVQKLIDRGFADAVSHDCARNQCVFPPGKIGHRL